MKIICSKANLQRGINIVSKAVPSKTTMSILECILIDANTDVIRMMANDLELGIETAVDGEIEEHGVIALDAKLFLDIVRELPDNDVVIETKNDFKTTITCKKTKNHIIGKSGEDFSYLPTLEKGSPVQISEFGLKEIIQQTIFSIADNDSNRMMTGELFSVEGDRLRVVSLDGHRISVRKVGLRESYEPQSAIVPGKTLQEICKILPDSASDFVQIYFLKNHIVFEFENTTVVSRLIEGEYFDVDRMLSPPYETKVTINRKDFIESINRALPYIREGDKKPILLNIEDGEITLKINSFAGSFQEELPIKLEGNELLIAFNPRFFLEVLRTINEDEVEMYMLDQKSPCIIRDGEETYIYLILPVNFNIINGM